MRIYRRTYAALYDWSLRQWKGDDYMASFLTAMTLGGAVVMNVATVLGTARFFLYTGPLDVWYAGPLLAGAVGGWFVLNYVWFVSQNRYSAIHRELAAMSIAAQRRIRKGAWTYLASSYTVPVVLAYFAARATGQI